MSGRPLAIPKWATDTLFPTDGGPDAGTSTKMAPGSYANQGMRRDDLFPGQYINYQLNALGAWVDYMKSFKAQNLAVVTSGASTAINAVTYSPVNRNWIAVGTAGKTYTSPTGQGKWFANAAVGGGTPTLYCAFSKTNSAVGVGGINGTAAYLLETNNDGASFTDDSAAIQTALTGAGVANSKVVGISFDDVHSIWIVVVVSSANATYVLTAATLGGTWTLRATVPAVARAYGVSTNPAGVSVIPGDQFILTTTNGTTWAIVSLLATGTLSCAAWDTARSMWVVGGSFGVIYTSPDAVTWTQQPVPYASWDFKTIACEGALWVAGADGTGPFTPNSFYLYSVDAGTTWVQRTFESTAGATGDKILTVATGDCRFVAGSNLGFLLSSPSIGTEASFPGGVVV